VFVLQVMSPNLTSPQWLIFHFGNYTGILVNATGLFGGPP